jgi:hypothetical protein
MSWREWAYHDVNTHNMMWKQMNFEKKLKKKILNFFSKNIIYKNSDVCMN